MYCLCLQVLGILGALDPYLNKKNQQLLLQMQAQQGGAGEGQLVGRGGDLLAAAGARGPLLPALEEWPNDMLPPGGVPNASSEEYFSTVAIISLLRILRDGSLAAYHLRVVSSLMYIFRTMGLGSVPYLPKVLPELFFVMRSPTCEDSLREFLLWQLAQLVTVVRQHARKFLPDLLNLAFDFWNPLLSSVFPCPPAPSPVLYLIEQLCRAMPDDFKQFLPEVIPRCIAVLADAERKGLSGQY